MSNEEAALTHISPASNQYTLISLKASNTLPPEKEQLRASTIVVSTQSSVNGPANLAHEYLRGSSPMWVVSDQIWRIPKTPESSLSQEKKIMPSSIHTYYTDKISKFPWASDSVESIQQHGKTKSILSDSSRTLAAYTSTSRYYGELPNFGSTQILTTEIFIASSTSGAKSSNGNDLTMFGNNEKTSLVIVLGSVSGAGIVLCAISILHRTCYRRFRESRKSTKWITQIPENLEDANNSFARHSNHREISRFSVDS